MAFIFTPRQLSLRAELYYQLGALIAAGLPLRKSIETLYENPIARAFRAPLRRLDAKLEQGLTFAESVTQSGGWLAEFDIALLRAGEESGRLDACLKILAEHYENRAKLMRMILGALAYPLGLLHFAIFVFPFATAFLSGDWLGYVRGIATTLLPPYLALFIVIYACQGQRGERWRHLLERVWSMVPVLGTALRNLALSRLAVCLEALLNAGMPIAQAWEQAAAASGSTILHRTVRTWPHRIDLGVESPGELVRESRVFPELFRNLYATGEATGSLDDSLRRLHRYYEDSAMRLLTLLAKALPMLIYLGVLIGIGIHVVRFWLNYYNGIIDAF